MRLFYSCILIATARSAVTGLQMSVISGKKGLDTFGDLRSMLEAPEEDDADMAARRPDAIGNAPR